MLSLKVFSCKLTSLYCKQTQKIVIHFWQESTSFKGRTFLTPQTPNGKNLWLLPDQSNGVFLLSSSKAILRHLDSYFLLPFRWTSFSLLLAPSCFFRHFCNSDKKELKIPLIVAPFLSLLQLLAWQLFSSAKNNKKATKFTAKLSQPHAKSFFLQLRVPSNYFFVKVIASKRFLKYSLTMLLHNEASCISLSRQIKITEAEIILSNIFAAQYVQLMYGNYFLMVRGSGLVVKRVTSKPRGPGLNFSNLLIILLEPQQF